MWFKWLPWRYAISRLARSSGFIDPFALLARLQRFSQPSEVAEPIELLRAGVIFHARGLINAKAIQHNLDWVWPYWVERQFNPHDESFVPRSFSITHVNLTHRNWTAVGQPGCDWLPIVDPRGLVTAVFDGWSLDFWLIFDDGPPLLPSRAANVSQHLVMNGGLAIETDVEQQGCALRSEVDVTNGAHTPQCRVHINGRATGPGWLVVAPRPVNPEGVSFIHQISLDDDQQSLSINDRSMMQFDRPPQRVCMSRYRQGDVLQQLHRTQQTTRVLCDVGMATAAAMFRLNDEHAAQVTVRIPQPASDHPERLRLARHHGICEPMPWSDALAGVCEINIPDQHMKFLFDAAVRSLVLHSPGDVYPGPYTYRRFWFRDAAYIIDALLALGMTGAAGRAIQRFPDRQTALGYFRSQNGEWDSNGEALWIMDRYRRFTGTKLDEHLLHAVVKGARWIRRKRLSDHLKKPHAGLLPAGFSAEHLGPNDFYYWDDFWSIAGLECAGEMLAAHGQEDAARDAEAEAAALRRAIDRSLEQTAETRDRPGVPASPYRRMDAGAIGSVAAGYPTQVWDANDPRLLETVEFLIENCSVHGGFFQDMMHSGINAYLTLHLAQVLLRAGDARHFDLMRTVAELASSTGQWPEAVHPRTGGGCMGDGQHIWAAAEWVLMWRNCFVREENQRLIIAAGIPGHWLDRAESMSFGPTPTSHGTITIHVTSRPDEQKVDVHWDADWHDEPPTMEIVPADCEPTFVNGHEQLVTISRPTIPTPVQGQSSKDRRT